MDTGILLTGAADEVADVQEAGIGTGEAEVANDATPPSPTPAADEASHNAESSATVAGGPLIDAHGNFVGKAWAGEDEKLAEKFTSIGALAKSYRNLEQMLARQDRVAVPAEGASEEEVAAFYAKLGRPESPDGYELPVPEELKEFEGLRSEEEVAAFRKAAHEAGLTPKQVQAVAQAHYAQVQGAIAQLKEAQTKARDEAISELAKGWGTSAESEGFKQHIAQARAGAKVLGIDAATLAASPELSSNPHFIRAMHRAAQMAGEKPAVAAREGQALSGNAIQERIDAILKNPDSPYWKSGHPMRKQTMTELTKLYEAKAELG